MSSEEANTKFIASLFDSSPAPIVAFDRGNVVMAWNPAAERLFGWTADEMLGRPYALIPEEGEAQYRAAIDRVFEGTSIPEYKANRRRNDGSLVDVSIAMAPIRNVKGEIKGALAIFNDITEQKIAEDRIVRLNNVLMTIREMDQLIVREKDPNRLLRGICDCLLKYREYNTVWIALWTESGKLTLRAQVEIDEFEAAFQEALDKNNLLNCIQQSLDRPNALVVEDREQTCAGCPLENAYPQREAIVARLEHSGNTLGFLGLSLPAGLEILTEERDLVSEIAADVAFALNSLEIEANRRRAEESLRRAESEARLQSEQLMQADKMVALGTLVSGVGHEINNPNSFVMLNVPLLKGMWDDAISILENHYQEKGDFRLRGIPFSKARDMIPQLMDDIMEGAWRIKRIVGELKDYARPQPTETTELVDVNEIVRSAIILCNTFINQHTQEFSTDYSEDLPQIQGSSQRIEQVVINLLQNACEALKDNKNAISIRTSYDRDRNGVVISVKDEGVGISEKNVNRITDPFYTTKREKGGTGLGLSITQKIVQNHRGTLSLESVPEKGTTVLVFLPQTFETQEGKTQ